MCLLIVFRIKETWVGGNKWGQSRQSDGNMSTVSICSAICLQLFPSEHYSYYSKLFFKKGPCHPSLCFPQPLGSYPVIAAASYNFVEGIHKKFLPKHISQPLLFPLRGKASFAGLLFYKASLAKWSNFWMNRFISDIKKTIREEFVWEVYSKILLCVS